MANGRDGDMIEYGNIRERAYKAKVKSANSTDADTLMIDINIIFGEQASPLLIKVRGMVELSPMFPLWIFPY